MANITKPTTKPGIAEILLLTRKLNANDLLLLRSEVSVILSNRQSSQRSLLSEALSDELASRGINIYFGSDSLRKPLLAAEESFATFFEVADICDMGKMEIYRIYRVAVSEIVRMLEDSPRPITAKTVLQVLGDAGGGVGAVMDNAFPGYGKLLPKILLKNK